MVCAHNAVWAIVARLCNQKGRLIQCVPSTSTKEDLGDYLVQLPHFTEDKKTTQKSKNNQARVPHQVRLGL